MGNQVDERTDGLGTPSPSGGFWTNRPYRRLRLRSEVFLVTRVAAFLAVDFAPDFFGEIFFSAIPVTPFDRPE
jgi:hypothetical protein